MWDYQVDRIPLSNAEEPYHKGFLNAALNRLAKPLSTNREKAELDYEAGVIAAEAYIYADAMIRERRNRTIFLGEDEPESTYRRIGNLEMEKRWLEREGRRKPTQALVLYKLQEREDTPIAESELRSLAGVTSATISALVAAGMLEKINHESEEKRVA